MGKGDGGDLKNTLVRPRSCTLIVPGVDALPRSAPGRRAPERLILVAMGFFFTPHCTLLSAISGSLDAYFARCLSKNKVKSQAAGSQRRELEIARVCIEG